jgi:hypothetical protein
LREDDLSPHVFPQPNVSQFFTTSLYTEANVWPPPGDPQEKRIDGRGSAIQIEARLLGREQLHEVLPDVRMEATVFQKDFQITF